MSDNQTDSDIWMQTEKITTRHYAVVVIPYTIAVIAFTIGVVHYRQLLMDFYGLLLVGGAVTVMALAPAFARRKDAWFDLMSGKKR